jgi:hypothetical protein
MSESLVFRATTRTHISADLIVPKRRDCLTCKDFEKKRPQGKWIGEQLEEKKVESVACQCDDQEMQS